MSAYLNISCLYVIFWCMWIICVNTNLVVKHLPVWTLWSAVCSFVVLPIQSKSSICKIQVYVMSRNCCPISQSLSFFFSLEFLKFRRLFIFFSCGLFKLSIFLSSWFLDRSCFDQFEFFDIGDSFFCPFALTQWQVQCFFSSSSFFFWRWQVLSFFIFIFIFLFFLNA